MGGSGGLGSTSSGKGAHDPSAVEWIFNPAGSAGQKWFGQNIDPLGQITAGGVNATISGLKGEQVVDPAGRNWLSDLEYNLLGEYTGTTTQDVVDRQNDAADRRAKAKEDRNKGITGDTSPAGGPVAPKDYSSLLTDEEE